jgi:PAS domain S-box-containing protein
MIMDVENTRSMILSPLKNGQKILGLIGLDFVEHQRKLSEDLKYFLQKCGFIFAGALKRKQLEKSENITDQRYRKLFSEIEDVVFMTTPEGRLLEINPAAAKFFGYESVQELFDLDLTQDFYLNPEDRKKYQEVLAEKGYVQNYELHLKRKDGSKIIALETSTAIHDENGKIIAYGGILRDITELRLLEQQFFQAQKMESIGLMAGGVAHDFNNILTTISGYAELMLMRMTKDDPHHQDVENILKGGKRAEDLIRQLLAFSRRQMIQPKIVDINKVISDLYNMLKRLIEENITFELKLADKLPFIKADPVQIQQILVNLVLNAGYAIKDNQEKTTTKLIVIATDTFSLKEKAIKKFPGMPAGEYIQISVEDSGVGMSEETKQKIFEPFFSTKRKGEGSGLGLSTIYGIVKQNNSFVFVESRPGKGSIFKIYWPASTVQVKEETRLDTKVKMQYRAGTVLFVEDDPDVREFTYKGLKTMGYTIYVAKNGKEALDLVHRETLLDKIDLLISDMVMPEMGGEELANRIYEMNPQIKILLCSGYTDSRLDFDDAHRKNGWHFLAKPFTMHKLEKKIRTILSEEA